MTYHSLATILNLKNMQKGIVLLTLLELTEVR